MNRFLKTAKELPRFYTHIKENEGWIYYFGLETRFFPKTRFRVKEGEKPPAWRISFLELFRKDGAINACWICGTCIILLRPIKPFVDLVNYISGG